jgi:hypothetical protein
VVPSADESRLCSDTQNWMSVGCVGLAVAACDLIDGTRWSS